MRPLHTGKKPFDQKVKYENETTWLIPKLVGEVKFTEWTSGGEMRHPAFLGLRTDKKVIDVQQDTDWHTRVPELSSVKALESAAES